MQVSVAEEDIKPNTNQLEVIILPLAVLFVITPASWTFPGIRSVMCPHLYPSNLLQGNT